METATAAMGGDYCSSMEHPVPDPPELGELDGLAYALFLPEGEPRAGVVILHGAGSAKESHFDFARGCRADGIAALAYDARGHGRSDGRFGPGALDDVAAMVRCCASTWSGWPCAGRAWAASRPSTPPPAIPSLCAVVAICPAPEDLLLRSLRSGELLRFECDVPATELWLESLDLYEAAGRPRAADRRCSCCTPAATSRSRGR